MYPPQFDRRFRFILPVALWLSIASGACQQGERTRLVALFCLDGATPEVIQDLRAGKKLPAFERLIRSGTFGRLESLAARRIMSERERHGFASPILWATIATGKVPEKHGVRDFVLPDAGTSTVWMGSEQNPPRAELTFPEIQGRSPFTLRLRLHSHGAVGEQPVRLLLNDEPLGTILVPVRWKEFALKLPGDWLRPAKNRLALLFSRQSAPAVADSSDRRRLACELAWLSIRDVRGNEVIFLDPVYQRFHLGEGFHLPRGEMTEVQSAHWRALPVWSLLGNRGLPVGIIGYWGTWPAYEVNGFLVSSRMGIRDQRRASRRLTWPPELATKLEPLAPYARDLSDLFTRLHVSECEPPLVDEKSVLKKIIVQDEYYFRIARELLPGMDRGLLSVYFRAIDVSSHVALHWRHGAPIPDNCPESAREIVDEVYVQIDRWVGALVDLLPEDATVVVVSDHGMRSIDFAGHHAQYGIFLGAGPAIRRGAELPGASVLDVTPTLLHLFGAPIPMDVDGHVLTQIFETDWLAEHPPRYADIDTSMRPEGEALTEGSEQVLEELRSLGYIH